MPGPLLIGAAALQVWGGLQQAEMIRKQAKLNEKISELNAKYIELDAYEAEKYGYTQAARYQSVIDQTVADQRVGFASQGVDVSSGTAKEIQEDTKLTGFLNTLDIQDQARKKALGLKIQASNVRIQSDFSTAQSEANASGATMSGIFSGIGTIAKGFESDAKGTANATKPKSSNYSGYGEE